MEAEKEVGKSEAEAKTESDTSLLRVEGLKKYFEIRGGLFGGQATVKAVDGVDLTLQERESMGLVGESGCGKTTVGRTILGLIPPTEGKVFFQGRDVSNTYDFGPWLKERAAGDGRVLNLFARLWGVPALRWVLWPGRLLMGGQYRETMRELRRNMQIIFQDPYASLNPRMTVSDIVGRGLEIHGLARGREKQERVQKLLAAVGLRPEHSSRFPHEFSGGQRQRIGVARALAFNPKLIICDEPTSALDVSVQAQILNLMHDLQQEYGLTYLFISHNLSVIRHVCDRIAVMYLGKIVEVAAKQELFEYPTHPYSEGLLSAVPIPNPKLKREIILLEGDIPSPANPPSGCYFHTRCSHRVPRCTREEPPLVDIGNGHRVACHVRAPAG